MANPNLQKIIKLTQTQYNTLSNGGSITYQGITYTGLNDNYLYLIQDDTEYATEEFVENYVDNAIGDLPDIPVVYLKNASTSGNTLTLTKQDNSTVQFTPTFTEQHIGDVISVAATANSGIAIGGTTANPTVGIDSNYKLPTTTEWGNKLDKKPDGTNDLISNNKISTTYIPDIILGQLVYGGTVTGAGVATLSTNAKTKLGTTDDSITLANSAGTKTSITGWIANEGIYYIVSSNGSFALLGLVTGDWLISTGSAWKKVDNTDAVTSVNGQTGAVSVGTITGVTVGGTSVATSGVATINTNTAYDATGNKLATMADIPSGETDITFNGTATSTTENLTNIVVDTKTYTIPQGTYSKPSGGIPAADLAETYVTTASANYIKSASASGNTLTLTKGNDGTVTFTPSFTDHNQKVKVSGQTSFGADDEIAIEGSGGTSVTKGTGKITISSPNITVSATNGVSDGTNTYKYTLPSNVVQDSNYAHITVTGSSVSDGTNTFNKYTHPTYTTQTAGLYKVGRDSTGHVVIGDAFTIPTKTSDLTNDSGFLTSSTGVTTVNGSSGAITNVAKTNVDNNFSVAQIFKDITLYTESGDSPRLIFQRGTLTDNYNDWSIYDTGGFLHIQQRGIDSSDWGTMATFMQSGVSFVGTVTIGTSGSITSGNTNAVTGGTVYSALTSKQDTLVSGTNIKTINNESILGSGNITINGDNYYPTAVSWTNGGASGPTGTITMSGTNNISIPAIPAASASYSGIVTTGGQTFAGNKGFNGSVVLNNGGTFYKPIYLGAGIPSKGDGSTAYFGEDLIMNRRSGAVSGFYAESSQWNRFLGLYMNPAYICTCNYKGDGSATAATSTDGLWKASQSGDSTQWSGYLGYLFNSNFTTGATFPVANLSTKPIVITIKSATGARIDATDTDYVELNGWRYEGYQGTSTNYYGKLTSYKLEILTDYENDTWVKTFERTNVEDNVNSIKFPVWSSVGGSASYTNFYGIRLTISGAVAGGSGYLGLTELKLMETRPAGAPADGVGAISQLGGNLYGNITLPSKSGAGKYTELKISPSDSDNYNQLGESNKQWYRIYGKTIYENGTALSSKYLGISAKAADADKLDGNDSTYYLNYNNLTNKPTIPTKTSDLTNDSGYITDSDLSNYVTTNTDQTVGGTKTFTSRPQLSFTPRLPNTYQEVKYIQASGSQYIDTGFKTTTEKLKVEFACAFPFGIAGQSLMGSNSPYNLVPYGNGNNTIAHWVGDSSGIMSINYDPTYNEVVYILNNGSISCTINGATISDTYSGSIINNYNFYIFGKNAFGNSAERGTGYRLYYMKIYNNDTLVRNLVPCYRKSDNEIGLYDLVNSVFYTNAGGGTFTKGASVSSSEFLVESDLATVATTGDYDDLNNKPSIPTISAAATAVSGATEAKSLTINGTNWNLPSGGSGTITDVKIGTSSIVSSGVATIQTNSTYDASSNKIATMNDVPTSYVSSINGSTGDITGIATTNDLSSYLPLSGGTMNDGASVSFKDLTATLSEHISIGASTGNVKLSLFPNGTRYYTQSSYATDYVHTNYTGSNYVFKFYRTGDSASGQTVLLPRKAGTIALTSDIGTPYIEADEVTSQTLSPNTYYDFGSRDGGSLTVTLGTQTADILNEYMFEIIADENDFTLNTPSDIIWKDNAKVTNLSNALTLSGKNTYQFSIVNKKGIIADFANPSLATPTLTISGSTLSWGAITNAEKYQVTTDSTARAEQTTTSLNISSYYPALGTLSAPSLTHSSTAVGTSTSNITLSWGAITNATNYKLTRSGASSDITYPTGTSTTVSSLTNGSTYNFVLTARNNQTVSCKVAAKSKYYNDSTSNTVSYTYAKYNESGNSNTVAITIPYSITAGTVSGGSLTNASGGIAPSGSTTVTISPNSGYTYPAQSAITVTNATISSYNASTGALTIANPTSNVKVSFTCPSA